MVTGNRLPKHPAAPTLKLHGDRCQNGPWCAHARLPLSLPAPQRVRRALQSSGSRAHMLSSTPPHRLPTWHWPRVASLEDVGGLEVHRPGELRPRRPREHPLDGEVDLLAPGHGDPGVHVVHFGGAEGHGLVLLLDLHLVAVLVQAYLGLRDLLPAGQGVLRQLAVRVLVRLALLEPGHVLLQYLDVLLHGLLDRRHLLHGLPVRLGLGLLVVA
mmetsp:Transcript_83189/g.236002  ORF Transcript_83189/g.236002 Transcript_83189/m.236002 type:complete len:214 (+) Transcript_83189:62-703(+)